MLSVQKLKQAGHAKGRAAAAVADYLLAGEYYIGQNGERRSSSRWLGEGARALGLSGEVERADFEQALNGIAPDGKMLAQNAGAGNRTLGFDLTFSADKSISLLFATATPEQRDALEKAHHAACDAGLDFLVSNLEARRGHAGSRRLPVDGVSIAQFDHFSSRELDPEVHSHCVMLNTARASDGTWGGFEASTLVQMKHAAGALYRAELAHQLRALGYGIESVRQLDAEGREDGQVWHWVAGVDEHTMDYFSKRRVQIEKYMKEHECDAQTACLKTRERKQAGGEPPMERVMEAARWELAHNPELRGRSWHTAADLLGRESKGLDDNGDAGILRRLHEHEATFDRVHLIDRLAKERGGELDAAGVLAEVDAFLARAAVVELQPDGHGRQRWASAEEIRLEQSIAQRALTRKNDRSVRLDAEAVKRAIAATEQDKGFVFTQQQREAVEFVACGSGGTACLAGFAGSGKTATSLAYIRAFKAAGHKVYGAAASDAAANNLRDEAGIETRNTSKLIAELGTGKLKLQKGDVVVLDEAGMSGVRSIASVQSYTDAAGAKLVMLGDPRQLQPVEAGAAWRLAATGGEATQTEIRRQREAADLALAKDFYGTTTGAELVAEIESGGRMTETKTQKEAQARLVADWVADSRPPEQKIVIAATNAQADALTAGIRQQLQERGKLKNEIAVETAGRLWGETKTMRVAVGDRVRFGKKDKNLGVVNNDIGTVRSIDAGFLEVELDRGVITIVDSSKYDRLKYGYAGTVHKAQGQTVEAAYWLADGKSITREMGLVASTRQRASLKVYVSEGGKQELAERLDRWAGETNAIDLLPHYTPQGRERKLERTPTLPPTLEVPIFTGDGAKAAVAKEEAWVRTQPKATQEAWAAYKREWTPKPELVAATRQRDALKAQCEAAVKARDDASRKAAQLWQSITASKAEDIKAVLANNQQAEWLKESKPSIHIGAKWRNWQAEHEELQRQRKHDAELAKDGHELREQWRKQGRTAAAVVERENKRLGLDANGKPLRRVDGLTQQLAAAEAKMKTLGLSYAGMTETAKRYQELTRPPAVKQALRQREHQPTIGEMLKKNPIPKTRVLDRDRGYSLTL